MQSESELVLLQDKNLYSMGRHAKHKNTEISAQAMYTVLELRLNFILASLQKWGDIPYASCFTGSK